MRHINKIIIHCSATPASMDVDITDIDRWHKERGFNSAGYHLFIKRNGDVQIGRLFNQVGAHAKGHNSYSIGVCYAGGVDENGKPEDNRTEAQKKALVSIVKTLQNKWKGAEVLGHCDLPNVSKACPSFDVGSKIITK